MGLFAFLKRLFGGGAAEPIPSSPASVSSPASTVAAPASAPAASNAPAPKPPRRRSHAPRREGQPPRLTPLKYQSSLIRTPRSREQVKQKPYAFASPAEEGYLDLTKDADQRWLDYYGLPAPQNPAELATWLGLSLGKLAWLTHRMENGLRATSKAKSHYHYVWVKKRRGGHRLLQAPKEQLKRVQVQILRKILDKVPTHPAAHGFVGGRSILTNAAPHVGQRFVLKFDLEDFYGTVRYRRVVAIFRALGYSREIALWLARLTTTRPPWDLVREASLREGKIPPVGRGLPQGAPTSPALANLSAFGLDVRLSGLAHAYGLTYTRYADDLTFSGPGHTVPALRDFIPLVKQIIKQERFRVNRAKTRVVRDNQRQSVTGVVVNSRPNVARADYDRLKATLHNCVKHGPSTQKRDPDVDFASHLRGRIAHVAQLNPRRGEKLLAMYGKIDWKR